ncbi:MAG: DUF3343 domain-containing protein [Candidatus Delongbacteria bacterium]|nr:DUF3343 domain-containing protein [Candidatus Delongbacteria bacterium]MBN2836215.1 DUF3343 domain-containing protein [Candidatus Delongbacteria bacterium]
MKYLILFFSTNHALWSEKLLKKSNIENKITSVPREFSSDCGYCVEFIGDAENVEKILIDNHVEYDRIIEMDNQ